MNGFLFYLQDLTYECGKYLAMPQSFPGLPQAHTPSHQSIVHQIRNNPHLFTLAATCQRYYQHCIGQKLMYLQPTDYDDFTQIICQAKKAFFWTQMGVQCYQELLNNIKRYIWFFYLFEFYALQLLDLYLHAILEELNLVTLFCKFFCSNFGVASKLFTTRNVQLEKFQGGI